MEGRIAAGVSRTLKGLEPMQNISLLLLGHECLVQREFLEQSCAAPPPPVGKDGDTGKAQGIQIPLDGSDGDGAMLGQFFRRTA